MQNVTLTVATVFSVLALILSPALAVGAYIMLLLLYPMWLVVQLGTLDISAHRIMIVILLLRFLLNGRLRRRFSWSRLDTWVTVSMAVYVSVFLLTRPFNYVLENRGGFLLDTWCVYLAARFVIHSLDDVKSMLKVVTIAVICLAVMGMFECTTGWQPFAGLMRHTPWRVSARAGEQLTRHGFVRALGPMGNAIVFGCAFAVVLPLLWWTRWHKPGSWRTMAYVGSLAAVLGAMSSMSSCAWLAIVTVPLCLALEKKKEWARPLAWSFVLSCIVVEIISNRRFYHVLASYSNFLGGAAWHRAAIIDLAIRHFREWWLLGYMGRDPGWGPSVGMDHTDVTSEYVEAGVYYGIWGIMVFCMVIFTALRATIRAFRQSTTKEAKSFFWAVGSFLVAHLLIWGGVAYFNVLEPLLYWVLGIVASTVLLADAPVPVLRRAGRASHRQTPAHVGKLSY